MRWFGFHNNDAQSLYRRVNMKTVCSANLVQAVCVLQGGTGTAEKPLGPLRGENTAQSAAQQTGQAMCSILD